MASFRKLYPLIFGALLTAFTAYSVLDTFVISSVSREAEINSDFVFVTSPETTAPDEQETESSDPQNSGTPASSAASAVSGSVSVSETAVSGSEVSGTVSAVSDVSNQETVSVSRTRRQLSNDYYDEEPEYQDDDPGVTKAPAETQAPETQPETEPPHTEEPPHGPVPENDGRLYMDENISIGIMQYRDYDTDIYVADVYVSSLAYLKAAFAHNQYGKNIKAHTSDIANEAGAIFAVNGDYYGAREHGYVVRNGVLYRDEASSSRECLMIKADGTFEFYREAETSAQALMDAGAYQVFTFGPGIVKNGSVSVSETDEVAQAMESNPRTAVGYVGPNHYRFVVSDGRTPESRGLSLYELGEFMVSLGISQAYNLDGGGSSSMVFQGEVINVPTADGHTIKERSVSDIVYIGY